MPPLDRTFGDPRHRSRGHGLPARPNKDLAAREALAPRVEIMVVGVPRDRIPPLQEAVARLNRPGLEMSAVVINGSTDAPEGDVAQSRQAPADATAEAALRSMVGLDPAELGAIVSPEDADAEARRAALFGAETAATTLAEQLTEAADALPPSHVAVLVAVCHDWRDDLASVIATNETEILMHRWLPGAGPVDDDDGG